MNRNTAVVASSGGVSAAQIAVVKSTIFPSATDGQLQIFLHKCQSVGVHPMDGLIHPVVYQEKLSFISSIDYLRSRAEATGLYDGQDQPEFEYDNENQVYPSRAIVRVYKKNISRAIVGVAEWSEFCPTGKKDFMYKKMPKIMLAKCAESQALRRAFPQQLAGIYSSEEMEQAENVAPPSRSTKPILSGVVEDVTENTTVHTPLTGVELADLCTYLVEKNILEETACRHAHIENLSELDGSRLSGFYQYIDAGNCRD